MLKFIINLVHFKIKYRKYDFINKIYEITAEQNCSNWHWGLIENIKACVLTIVIYKIIKVLIKFWSALWDIFNNIFIENETVMKPQNTWI